MPHLVSSADHELRRALESSELAPSDFDHRLHIRLAYVFLCERSQDAALAAMRRWTLRFLDVHGVDPAKYSETLTRAWMLAVRHFMARTQHAACSEDFLRQSPRLLDSRIMATHYSAERLATGEARRAFVEPDLDPIPRHPDVAA